MTFESRCILLCAVLPFFKLQAFSRLGHLLLVKPYGPLLATLWGNCPHVVSSSSRKGAIAEHTVWGRLDVTRGGAEEQLRATESNWRAAPTAAQDISGSRGSIKTSAAACSQRHGGLAHCRLEIQGLSKAAKFCNISIP